MTLSAFLMGFFMTSLAVTVQYKEKFYNENCLRLSPNSSLPESCGTNITIRSVQVDRGMETIKLVLDIWPAVSVILYMLGRNCLHGPSSLSGNVLYCRELNQELGITIMDAFKHCITKITQAYSEGLFKMFIRAKYQIAFWLKKLVTNFNCNYLRNLK